MSDLKPINLRRVTGLVIVSVVTLVSTNKTNTFIVLDMPFSISFVQL